MRKTALLGIFILGFLFLSGCQISKVEEQVNDSEKIHYEDSLIVQEDEGGVFTEGSLILRKTFEDHTDVVVFTPGTRVSYFDSEENYLPGNTITFQGEVEFTDGAAGTHYYDVVSIDTLEFSSYATKEQIVELIERYNSCENDFDCVDFYPGCPLGCSNPVNKNNLDIITKIANAFTNHQEEKCMYSCLAPEKIVCENYKCKGISVEKENKSNDGLFAGEVSEANAIFSK